jgi:hypothetical protein
MRDKINGRPCPPGAVRPPPPPAPPQPLQARTASDFAHEFAGYMASAAKHYCDVLDRSAMEVALGRVPLFDELTEGRRHLNGAIYEWEKRVNRIER